MTSYALNSAANDRSGPFDRFDGLPHGLTPSCVQGPFAPDDALPRQPHRRTSSLHAVEHNPFETSFRHPTVQPSPRNRKHLQTPELMMPLKRPKADLLKQNAREGSGSDSGNGTAKSNSTMPPSTATDSNRGDSPPEYSSSYNIKQNSSGSLSDASSSGMSKSLSVNSQVASVPMVFNRSLPAPTTAQRYEKLVREYAQQASRGQATYQPPPSSLTASDASYRAVPTYAPVILQPSFETHVPPPAIEHLQDLAQQDIDDIRALRAPDPAEDKHKLGRDQRANAAARAAPSSPERSEDDTTARTAKHGRKKGKKAAAKRESQVSVTEQTNDEDAPSEDRRAHFLERNRVAASKSRQKKKEWIAGLEQMAEATARRNADLQSVINGLRDEVSSLRTALAANSVCSCQQMHNTCAQHGVQFSPVSPNRVLQQKRASGDSSRSPSYLLHQGLSPTSHFGGDYFCQRDASGDFNTPDLTRQLGF